MVRSWICIIYTLSELYHCHGEEWSSESEVASDQVMFDQFEPFDRNRFSNTSVKPPYTTHSQSGKKFCTT